MFFIPPPSLFPGHRFAFAYLRSNVVGFANLFLGAVRFFLPPSCDAHGRQFSTSCHMCINIRYNKLHASKRFQSSVRKQQCRHFHAIRYVRTHPRLSVYDWRQRYRTKLEKKKSFRHRVMNALRSVASIFHAAKNSILNIFRHTIRGFSNIGSVATRYYHSFKHTLTAATPVHSDVEEPIQKPGKHFRLIHCREITDDDFEDSPPTYVNDCSASRVDGDIEILVHLHGGGHMPFQVTGCTTALDLKLDLATVTHIPVHRQRLHFNKVELCNHDKLGKLGITTFSTITQVVRGVGGTQTGGGPRLPTTPIDSPKHRRSDTQPDETTMQHMSSISTASSNLKDASKYVEETPQPMHHTPRSVPTITPMTTTQAMPGSTLLGTQHPSGQPTSLPQSLIASSNCPQPVTGKHVSSPITDGQSDLKRSNSLQHVGRKRQRVNNPVREGESKRERKNRLQRERRKGPGGSPIREGESRSDRINRHRRERRLLQREAQSEMDTSTPPRSPIREGESRSDRHNRHRRERRLLQREAQSEMDTSTPPRRGRRTVSPPGRSPPGETRQQRNSRLACRRQERRRNEERVNQIRLARERIEERMNNNHSSNENADPSVARSLRDLLQCASNGHVPDNSISNAPEITDAQRAFVNDIDSASSFHCPLCKQLTIHSYARNDSRCSTCTSGIRGDDRIAKFCQANDMDPREIPSHLPTLTPIEELLISRAHPVMKYYRLSTGAQHPKGNVITFQQDVTRVANMFPLTPDSIPVVIVKKKISDSPPIFKDFRVRRMAILTWLLWLKRNNHLYTHIEIDRRLLHSLPIDGNVAHRLRSISESDPDGGDAATEEDEDPPTAQQGPEQGGATGFNHDVQTSFIPQVTTAERRSQAEVDANNLGASVEPVAWQELGPALSEFTTVHLQAMAFPTLFPYGKGDVTFGDRPVDVTFTESNHHLTRYAEVRDGKWVCRFASHSMWPHWAQNIAERHRAISQRNVYLSKTPEDANLSEAELREIIRDPARLKAMMNRMRTYNSNITGSPSYFFKKRTELEALCEQEGLPTIWFTLSAADNHWKDLHRLLTIDSSSPDSTDQSLLATKRRRAVREYPHLVDEYIHLRVKWLLEKFFSTECMDKQWLWFRCEFQKRGTLHIHGCCRLKSDPGLAEHGSSIFRGRMAWRLLTQIGRNTFLTPTEGEQLQKQIKNDVWVSNEPDESVVPADGFTEEHIASLQGDVRQAILSNNVISAYHDVLLTTKHPSPPVDATSGVRNDCTVFTQSPTNTHPAADCPFAVISHSPDSDERLSNYCSLINSCERHKCSRSYCLRCLDNRRSAENSASGNDHVAGTNASRGASVGMGSGPNPGPNGTSNPPRRRQTAAQRILESLLCRFGYPYPVPGQPLGDDAVLPAWDTHVKIKQFYVGKGDKRQKRHRIELITERNDAFLNSHCRPIMEVWRANMDMQLVVDPGKVAEYMTKYITKSDTTTSRAASSIFSSVLDQAVDAGDTIANALRRTMVTLMGEREIGPQETAHLNLNLDMVNCSHSFVKVHLENKIRRVIRPSTRTQSGTNNPNVDDRQSIPSDEPAVLMTRIDAYAKRHSECLWAEEDTFLVAQPHLDAMSLQKFCAHYTVCQQGRNRNKIKVNEKNNVVVQFTPKFSCKPEGKNYAQYCKWSLMKYRPWRDRELNAWRVQSSEELTDVFLKTRWNAYLDELNSSGVRLPDTIIREVQVYEQFRGDLLAGGLLDGDESGGVSEADANDAELPPDEGQAGIDDLAQAVSIRNDIDVDDPSDVNVAWARDHDWHTLQHEYGQSEDGFDYTGYFQSLAVRFCEMVTTHVNNSERERVLRAGLNVEQKQAHDAFIRAYTQSDSSSTDGGTGMGRLQLLLGKGGCGKSYAINSMITTVSDIPDHDVNREILVLATTGKAACSIGGATIHSYKEGLGIPCGKRAYSQLCGNTLKGFQDRLGDVRAVFIDEFSMLRAKELSMIDKRLRQIKPQHSHLPFGGVVIVLTGDPAQLPPVQGTELWHKGSAPRDIDGYLLYRSFFTTVTILDKIERIDASDPNAEDFIAFQGRLRDGCNTEDDWNWVRSHCSRHSMGDPAWERRGFDGHDVTKLFTTNEDVSKWNKARIVSLNKPIALVEAEHSSPAAKRAHPKEARQLDQQLYLCVDSYVLLTSNICPSAGLCNGSTGTVKEIVYLPDQNAPGQPFLVIVDFGDGYSGPAFFDDEDRRGWVPIQPMTAEWHLPSGSGEVEEHWRRQLPLRLSWAWTVWKAQGQTITGRLVLDLGTHEKEHGLTYTAFSRATRISQIGIYKPMTKRRLTSCIGKGVKLKRRVREEGRLKQLAQATSMLMQHQLA